MRTELTQELVGGLAPGKTRQDFTDITNPGFGVRVCTNGVKTWFYRYRLKDTVRLMRLGRASYTSLAAAKGLYQRARDRRLRGIDPQGRHPVSDEAFMKLFDVWHDLNTLGELPEKLGDEPTLEEFSAHYGMSQSAVKKLAAHEYLALLERGGRKVVIPLTYKILRDVGNGDISFF